MAGQTAAAQALIDVHQHLWPAELIDALRARTRAPRLDGWTLYLAGEPPYQLRRQDHDQRARQMLEQATLALVSLSSPLGLEDLDPSEGGPLLQSWHAGAARLPPPFRAWAAVTRTEPDLAELKDLLGAGFAGLQIPASWMANPAALESLSPVLEVCQAADRPVLVHPGPLLAEPDIGRLPAWWAAVAGYPAQLQSAWWSWQVTGRSLLPDLRICFAAGAGLAPVHHERFQARGGSTGAVDPSVFVETSSYGPQAIDALIRALGIDVIVAGSDRPYCQPSDFRAPPFHLGNAAALAITSSNPRRFLAGGPVHPGGAA